MKAEMLVDRSERGVKKKNIFRLEIRTRDASLQGRIVRKPINANPGLKVNRGNNFSCIKALSIAYVLCSLRLLMLKTEGQKVSLLKSYKNEIKLLANPGLA